MKREVQRSWGIFAGVSIADMCGSDFGAEEPGGKGQLKEIHCVVDLPHFVLQLVVVVVASSRDLWRETELLVVLLVMLAMYRRAEGGLCERERGSSE